jgi:predicted N-acetyltransferase YhbS
MAVDEKFQGKKIGHKLLQTVIAKAEEIGLSNIILIRTPGLNPPFTFIRSWLYRGAVGNASYKRSDIKMEKELLKNHPQSKTGAAPAL